ncbi:hypothetical protein B0H10DRAFT_1950374 [Mycena sp. CBHHK59/15]|nr:hypothetical protein B0H10DRAFT_1950374 [Mycena sp. CBHHK59/15]
MEVPQNRREVPQSIRKVLGAAEKVLFKKQAQSKCCKIGSNYCLTDIAQSVPEYPESSHLSAWVSALGAAGQQTVSERVEFTLIFALWKYSASTLLFPINDCRDLTLLWSVERRLTSIQTKASFDGLPIDEPDFVFKPKAGKISFEPLIRCFNHPDSELYMLPVIGACPPRIVVLRTGLLPLQLDLDLLMATPANAPSLPAPTPVAPMQMDSRCGARPACSHDADDTQRSADASTRTLGRCHALDALVRTGLEIAARDRQRAMMHVDGRARRLPSIADMFSHWEPRMLTPGHILRGVVVRGWDWTDELGMALLGCLSRSGVPLQRHPSIRPAQTWAGNLASQVSPSGGQETRVKTEPKGAIIHRIDSTIPR